jgi:periplasmic mercuric ion binding protein
MTMGLKMIRTAMLGVAALALGALTTSASAAEATLTGVHNCCKSCQKAIDAAVTGAGGKAKIEKSTITVTADDEAGVKKAVAALLAAGYFGDGAPAGAAAAPTAPSDAKAKSVTVEGVHLCCGKCVDAFNKAVKTAAGAIKTDAAKNAKSVLVEGDVSPKDVLDALHKAGFNASVK